MQFTLSKRSVLILTYPCTFLIYIYIYIYIYMYIYTHIYIYIRSIYDLVNKIVEMLAMNIIRDHNVLCIFPFSYVFIYYFRTSVAQNI